MTFDTVLSALVLTAVVMCLMGFMSEQGVFVGRLNKSGAYWTFGMLVLLPLSMMIDVPWWAVGVNVLGLFICAVGWFRDLKEETTQ